MNGLSILLRIFKQDGRGQTLSRTNVWLVSADVEQFYMNVNLNLAASRLEAVIKGKAQEIKGLLSIEEAKTFMTFVNRNTYFSYEDG